MKFELYKPIMPWLVTQNFGDTALLPYYKANGINFVGHNGIDIAAAHGTPVRASHDGTAYYQIDQNQGHGVVIITNEQYDYAGTQCYFKSLYWHLCDPVKEPTFKSPLYNKNPNIGVPVQAGDIIGYADNTGLSTGNHLHFGVKPVAKGEPNNTWGNILQNNGTQGAIDPAPFFNGKFAENAKRFIFSKDIEMGDDNEDVRQLQKRLRTLGYFNYPTDTGYYGNSTRTAVYAFQLDHVKLGWFAKNIYRGIYCSKATREALNGLLIN